MNPFFVTDFSISDSLKTVRKSVLIYEDYKWQKLTTAAAYYDYDWAEHEEAHNSLGDCFATLFVYHKILSEE